MNITRILLVALFCGGACATCGAGDEPPLRVAVFQVDATPPLGSPLCDGAVPPVQGVDDPLSARGFVLLGQESPVVLCAVDWVGIGGGGHDAWRKALAAAAGTTPQRVAVHALHQHDAPGCDFAAEELLAAHGLGGRMFNVEFARDTIRRAADAARRAIASARAVTHVSLGRARVDQVASNRRILGPDGRVQHVRWSYTADPEVRAAPEGTIDPELRLIGLWNGDAPLVSLTFYATHPQSYHGKGRVSADTVGLARARRERELPAATHIHFNGASGNVTLGKYFLGTREDRDRLAGRIADGMRAAWDAAQKTPLARADVAWRSEPVMLPASGQLVEAELRRTLADVKGAPGERVRAARDLAWLARLRGGQAIDVGCLRIGPARVLFLPGELFVEYQLAAQAMRPRELIAMAAYGDYAPGYIGTAVAYTQGGYETGRVSRVAPQVERVLRQAIERLLE